MPSKDEANQIKKHLFSVSKAAAETCTKTVSNSASTIYSNDKKVVLSSMFKKTKLIEPKGKAIDIGENLLDNPFNN